MSAANLEKEILNDKEILKEVFLGLEWKNLKPCEEIKNTGKGNHISKHVI